MTRGSGRRRFGAGRSCRVGGGSQQGQESQGAHKPGCPRVRLAARQGSQRSGATIQDKTNVTKVDAITAASVAIASPTPTTHLIMLACRRLISAFVAKCPWAPSSRASRSPWSVAAVTGVSAWQRSGIYAAAACRQKVGGGHHFLSAASGTDFARCREGGQRNTLRTPVHQSSMVQSVRHSIVDWCASLPGCSELGWGPGREGPLCSSVKSLL